MPFNRLIPLYADRSWDALIPESINFDYSTIIVTFTQDSTRVSIQPLRLIMMLGCCASGTDDECFQDSIDEGRFNFLIQVFFRKNRLWKLATSSCGYLDRDLQRYQCVEPIQRNKCLGLYAATVEDLELYSTIRRWMVTSQVTVGDITDTNLHLETIGALPCKVNRGKLENGRNISINPFYEWGILALPTCWVRLLGPLLLHLWGEVQHCAHTPIPGDHLWRK